MLQEGVGKAVLHLKVVGTKTITKRNNETGWPPHEIGRADR